MIINNGSAIISLDRLKELEKLEKEIEDIKQSYQDKMESLTIRIQIGASYRHCILGKTIIVDSVILNSEEVNDTIKKQLDNINTTNTLQYVDFKKEIIGKINKNNFKLIDRIFNVFVPWKIKED